MISVKVFIVLYLLGMFTFTCVAEFGTVLWDSIWGFWQNIAYGSTLAWWCLYCNVRGEIRLIVKPVFYYSLLLLGWEFLSLFTGLSINNTAAVAIFFGITAILIGYIALWRNTSVSRLFVKYLRL